MNPPKKEKSHDPNPPPPHTIRLTIFFVRMNPYFLRTVHFKQGSSYTKKHNKIMHNSLPETRSWNELEGKTLKMTAKKYIEDAVQESNKERKKYIFFLIKPTDALINQIYFCQENLHVTSLCPSSGVFHCTFGTGICHAGLMTAFLVVFESCHQTCMTYASAECTVENSWWWAEELPETCKFSWQK